MSNVIYCISGLGADEKIFSRLELNGYTLEHIPWLKPQHRESLESYATRMKQVINHPSPVLMGVSFGGMMAIEISRQLPDCRLVLVSSVKTRPELPLWMRISGNLRLNRLMPLGTWTKSSLAEKMNNDRLGVSTPEEAALARDYRKKADPAYVNWAIDRIVNWRSGYLPPHRFLHVHGESDKIFPVKRIKSVEVMPGATHMMIYNRAAEVSALIQGWLQTNC